MNSFWWYVIVNVFVLYPVLVLLLISISIKEKKLDQRIKELKELESKL